MTAKAIETKIMNPQVGTTIPLPSYATDGSAALDLRACILHPRVIHPGETVTVPSGIAINIQDPSLVAILAPRSGLGIKHGIVLANTIGVIDSDYQGEIMIGLFNRSEHPYEIQPGERVCQMLFLPVLRTTLAVVEAFSEMTGRGSGGFGHTGRH